MPLRIDKCQRLEPRARDRDLQNGFAARLHDPLWLLARQWQMGEHQGENATSPVRVNYTVSRTPIDSFGGKPALDPKKIPAEAIVESERDDWWTMGRRIRAGARLEGLPEIVDAKGVRFTDPPPPYGTFVGHLDGRAVWRARERLGVPASAFGDDTPPDESAGAWDSFRLNYHGRFESGEGALVVSDHHGGPMDWYSGDGDPASATGSAEPVSARAIPTPLEYPGAPHSRFWEIEDARVDIGGYPPDSAHFATMLLVDLVYSHGDDWFMFPVAGRSGSIVTIRSLEVVDSFGRHYSSEARLADNSPLYPGLHPPADFSLFPCKGLTPESLVLWPIAEAPLESAPLERVQFGTDEQSNLLWALERVIDSREVQRVAAEADAGHPAYPAPAPAGDTTRTKNYFYVPASGAESRWHPYKPEWEEDGELAFVQWGLADYSLQHPRPMPHAYAEVLKAGTPESPERHRIAAAAMAAGGMELERRWQLARDVGGRPVLWAQRQRRALRTPPARNLRFDLMVEVAPVT